MNDRTEIARGITVGKLPPSREAVEQLASEGYATVVNLRTAAEANQLLTPEEEGEAVRAAGLRYLHLPVASGSADPELIDRFRSEIDKLPAPVFVHCASGRRAGLFSVLAAAAAEGLCGEEALRKAATLGFDWSAPELQTFVRQYLDRTAS